MGEQIIGEQANDMNKNPDNFLRLEQIIGNQEKGIPAMIPVSKTTWYKGVKEGRYPPPVKLSERARGWRTSDIIQCIQMNNAA
ncbi:MAG: AlpA family phage regulatory protein [Magnetococcus sp. YQC-9]